MCWQDFEPFDGVLDVECWEAGTGGTESGGELRVIWLLISEASLLQPSLSSQTVKLLHFSALSSSSSRHCPVLRIAISNPSIGHYR